MAADLDARYSVAVPINRFQLPDEDEEVDGADPFDLIRKESAKIPPKETDAKKKKTDKNDKTSIQKTQPKSKKVNVLLDPKAEPVIPTKTMKTKSASPNRPDASSEAHPSKAAGKQPRDDKRGKSDEEKTQTEDKARPRTAEDRGRGRGFDDRGRGAGRGSAVRRGTGRGFEHDYPPRFQSAAGAAPAESDREDKENQRGASAGVAGVRGPYRGARGGGGGGFGRGRGRGRGFGGADYRAGKREYERHSGSDRTGIKPVDKREGSGAHNWGTMEDEMHGAEDFGEANASVAAVPETAAPEKDQPAGNAEVPAAADADTSGAEAAVPEEEGGAGAGEQDNVAYLTLEEYKTSLAAQRVRPQYKLRQAGEGEDQSKWKKTYVSHKPDPALVIKPATDWADEDDDEDEEAAEVAVLPISIEVSGEKRTFRGGRGGRGGPPGERGAPAYRSRGRAPPRDRPAGSGRRSGEAPPKIDDENFPKLG